MSMNTRPCRFFLNGNCRNGTECRFYHDGFSSIPQTILSESSGSTEEASVSPGHRAERMTDGTSLSSSSSPRAPSSSSYRPTYAASTPCHWYLAGYCHRGDTCWFSHDRSIINGGRRENIDLGEVDETMTGTTGQPNDLLEANDREDDEDDEDQKCAICFEVPKTFGLLVSCNHAFCLTCIRTWRSKETAADLQPYDGSNVSVTKACPNCRTPSLYVVPSSFFPTCPEQKEIIIQNYKEATSRKTCKYFAESGDRHWCPFGDGCFFAHLDENGEHCKVNPESSPRRQRQRRIERRNRFGNRNVYDAIAQMRQGVLETMRASHSNSTEEELAGFETLLVELSSRLSSLNFDRTDFDYNFWDEIPSARNVVFDDDFGNEWYETDGEDDDAEGEDEDDYESDYGYHYHYDYDDPDVRQDYEFNRSVNRTRRRYH